MVFQSFNLFPHLTVMSNITLAPMKVRKWPRAQAEEAAIAFLERVGIPEQADKYPAELSGGQQQRVAVARALVFEPDLVLMDEPLGALDKNLREEMQYEIKHIHEELGVTVIYVTHDQAEALTMSNRIAVFNDGVIQQLATPSALYEEPENAFVAQFIGENNRLFGQVTSVDSAYCRVALDGGGVVSARCIKIEEKGQRTTLSLRPERVIIAPENQEMANSITGCVEELIYLGDHIRARLTVAGNDEFIVKIPNTDRQVSLSRGMEVALGWAADDCRALDCPALDTPEAADSDA
jgi:putative spermidine/putrescine transport system ATP-binding protein